MPRPSPPRDGLAADEGRRRRTPSGHRGFLHAMMARLRRILVTALFGALVGLGVITALFGRRPRRRVGAAVPVAGPSPVARRTDGWRGRAAGLAGLSLLIGLAGIVFASRDMGLGPGSRATADGTPLAALPPPDAGADRSPAPKPDASTRARPTQARGRSAALSPPAPPPARTVPDPDVVQPSGDAGVAGRAAPNAGVEPPVDGRPVANAQADAHGPVTHAPSSPDQPTVILSRPDGPAARQPAPGTGPGRQALRDGGAAGARPDPPAPGRNAPDSGDDLRGSGAGGPTTGELRDRAEVPFAAPGPGVEDAPRRDTAREAAGSDRAAAGRSARGPPLQPVTPAAWPRSPAPGQRRRASCGATACGGSAGVPTERARATP